MFWKGIILVYFLKTFAFLPSLIELRKFRGVLKTSRRLLNNELQLTLLLVLVLLVSAEVTMLCAFLRVISELRISIGFFADLVFLLWLRLTTLLVDLAAVLRISFVLERRTDMDVLDRGYIHLLRMSDSLKATSSWYPAIPSSDQMILSRAWLGPSINSFFIYCLSNIQLNRTNFVDMSCSPHQFAPKNCTENNYRHKIVTSWTQILRNNFDVKELIILSSWCMFKKNLRVKSVNFFFKP